MKVATFRTTIAVALGIFLSSAGASAQESIEYYATDAVGSVRVVFDSTGAVESRMDYEPFGEPLFQPTVKPNEQFAGWLHDEETDLAYAKARQYQSHTGRFTTVDPVFANLFDPQQLNRYTYARSGAPTFTDPSGLVAMYAPDDDDFVNSVSGLHFNDFATVPGSGISGMALYRAFFATRPTPGLGPNLDAMPFLGPSPGLPAVPTTTTAAAPTTDTGDGGDGDGDGGDGGTDDPRCGGDSSSQATYFISAGGVFATIMGADVNSSLYFVPSTGEWGFAFTRGVVVGFGGGLGFSFGKVNGRRNFEGEGLALSAGAGPVGMSAMKSGDNRSFTGKSFTLSPYGFKGGAYAERTHTRVVKMGTVTGTCK